MVPLAMMFTTLGLMLIVIGVVWSRTPLLAGLSWPISNDFLRGFLFGFALVLEIAGVAMAAQAAALKRKKS
jgi:hypothetical protein